LKEQGLDTVGAPLDVYAVIPEVSALPRAMACIQQLRDAGVCVMMHTSTPDGMASMKSQFKKADASGARYALVFGPEELAQGGVTVKALRETGIPQVIQPLDQPAQWAKSLQSNA
jgi:histidyl-tRNA synthetase